MFRQNREEAAENMAGVITQMQDACAREDHQAYRQLDSVFHWTIIKASRNSMIVGAYSPLSAKVDALRNRGLEDIEVVRRSLEFHKRLSGLLAANDAGGFCAGLKQYISNSSHDYAAWLARDGQQGESKHELCN